MSRTRLLILSFLLLIVGLVGLKAQNGLLSGPAQTPAMLVTFKQVPVTTVVDQPYSCAAPAYANSVCGFFADLVQQNNSFLDSYLTKWHIEVKDASGSVIFPRPVTPQ